ncbi:MAG: alanine dehydrogenase [Candidatus Bathyarchaeia archaeon]
MFETLALSDDEVKSLLSMSDVIEAVEFAFREKGFKRVQMPPKIYLFFDKYNGDLRAMPSYIETIDVAAVKIVNSHSENREKYGLPTVMGIIVLIDPRSGFPEAIMGGTTITGMRTGAAGGIAAKYLARKGSKSVGIIGAGAQAKLQLAALIEVFKSLDEVKVHDINEKNKKAFKEEMDARYGHICRIKVIERAEDAVRGSDIIVTATPSRAPIVMDEWVSSGMHFNCIGADAPGKEELDPHILKRAKIVVDDLEQAAHSGEINVPLSMGIISKRDIWAELGEIVAGKKEGRVSEEEITVFTSTGLAIQDAVTANLAYKKALEKGVGRRIRII